MGRTYAVQILLLSESSTYLKPTTLSQTSMTITQPQLHAPSIPLPTSDIISQGKNDQRGIPWLGIT